MSHFAQEDKSSIDQNRFQKSKIEIISVELTFLVLFWRLPGFLGASRGPGRFSAAEVRLMPRLPPSKLVEPRSTLV